MVAENDVPGGPPVAAVAPVAAPQAPWVVLSTLFGAILCADHWASALPATDVATFLDDQARVIVLFLFFFALAGALGRGKPFHGLREPLFLVPVYLAQLVPSVASMVVAWEGGWILGIAGAAVGAAAGAAMGWLFARWTLPEIENRPREHRRVALPMAFAGLFAVFGAYNWAITWLTPDQAWGIGVVWILLALPGALVGRPVLGLLVVTPLVLLMLIPPVVSMTVGWEGGWILGIAGAAVGVAAGVAMGWLFNRWIMPEYDKRRARDRAVRPPGSTDGPGLSESIAERS
jgi:hypothetical protein